MMLITWLLNAVGVMIVAYLIPGITVDSFWVALIVALVLGLLNMFLRPLIVVLTLPVNIVTLGLFTFVINGIILLLVDAIVPGFRVDGFWVAVLGSIVLTIIQWFTSSLAKSHKRPTRF